MSDYTKCQAIAVSLLKHLECDSDEGVSIIRRILDTSKCDVFHDFSQVRESTVERLNRGDPLRARWILNDNMTDKDRRVANRVVFEYKEWYIQELSKSLSWHTWGHYQLNLSPNEFYRIALIGLGTGLIGSLSGFGIRSSVAASGVITSMTTAPYWFVSKLRSSKHLKEK
jgi:hypothetical protein